MLRAPCHDPDPELSRPIRLLGIVGTRPEAIKIAPVALAAAGRAGVEHRILATGQHGAMFDEALAAFGLSADERIAVVHDPDPDAYAARLRGVLIERLRRDPPDMVIVQGDTSTAYAAARAAATVGLPLAHVEAGLRSGDLADPWPEERNRVAIDRLATLLFAPTPEAAAKLAAERCEGAVLITGNTGIDALLWMRGRVALPAPGGRGRILVTCHRRESFGQGIAEICSAVLTLADRGDVAVTCPVHSNPAVAEMVRARLAAHPAITLTDALGYADWVAAMVSAHLILTDSGGIQEEAPALGVPTLVLRHVTERPEALATGNLRLVGTDPATIVAAATRLLDDPAAHAAMARPAFPYGDGRAGVKIIDQVEQYCATLRLNDLPLPSPRA
jgi:UDP-N-acetylglucosamine 2-epimerase (non-hydrolysing)